MNSVVIANMFNFSGGGVNVTCDIAQILAELNYDVTFFALNGYNVETLDRIFGTRLSTFIGKNLHLVYSDIPLGLKPAYIYHGIFVKKLKELVDKLKPDLLVVFDDVPTFLAEDRYRNVHVILYSHFPLCFHKNVLHVNTLRYLLIEHIHHVWGCKYYYVGKAPSNWTIVANSSVTAAALYKLLGRVDKILYPPITKPDHIKYSIEEKRRIIASIGVLEPTKRFKVIIRALKKIKNGRLIVMGHLVNKQYYSYLVKEVRRLDLRDRVMFLLNVPNTIKWKVLGHAMIIAHAKVFEPFGIAVAEGMSAGAVPVVYKGLLSGPWIDIVEKGKYGFGFRNEEELVNVLEDLMSDYDKWKDWSKVAHIRSKYFDYNSFKNTLLSLL